MKKPDLDRLLEAWQDGGPAEAEAGELIRALEDPEARARLRQIWFLESGLGEALRTAAVRQTAPRLVSPADAAWGGCNSGRGLPSAPSGPPAFWRWPLSWPGTAGTRSRTMPNPCSSPGSSCKTNWNKDPRTQTP